MTKEESTAKKQKETKSKGFLSAKLEKIRTGTVKCPFCKEVCQGIRELGLHIKELHCR